ncbi:hypothetical protein LZ31DRAFT_56448 [Colletotrichum somersetense]|nr:hypothetical protein LZ31DRAFT_56448 [Colletotrichum somersetense]
MTRPESDPDIVNNCLGLKSEKRQVRRHLSTKAPVFCRIAAAPRRRLHCCRLRRLRVWISLGNAAGLSGTSSVTVGKTQRRTWRHAAKRTDSLDRNQRIAGCIGDTLRVTCVAYHRRSFIQPWRSHLHHHLKHLAQELDSAAPCHKAEAH